MSELIHTPEGSFDSSLVTYAHYYVAGRQGWICCIDLGSGNSKRTLTIRCKDQDDARAWWDRIVRAASNSTRGSGNITAPAGTPPGTELGQV